MSEPISEPRSLYRLRDKLKKYPSGDKVDVSAATLLMLVEELIEARKTK
jgi:hypothetical protein